DTADVSATTAGLAGVGSMKSLHVGRGLVTPGGTMTVLTDLDFNAPDTANHDAILDVQLNGTGTDQFGQLVVGGSIDVGNLTTFLQVRPIVPIPEAASMDILVNNSNTLTAGRFKNAPGNAPDFTVDEIIANDGQHFFIDYKAGDGNEVRITKNTAA